MVRAPPAGTRVAPEARDADLTERMSARQLLELPQQQQDELRNVRGVAPRQVHVADFMRRHSPQPLAGPQPAYSEASRTTMYRQLFRHADPIPDAEAIVRGIPHKSDRAPEDEPQEMVKAIATRKVHYFKQLREFMTADDPASGGNHEALKFSLKYPDPRYDHQAVVLDEEGHRWWADYVARNRHQGEDMPLMQRLVSHILNKHDGEVRLLGDSEWELVPAAGGDWPFHPRFWHHQFMKHPDTRRHMKARTTQEWKDEPLDQDEAAWILRKENNETTLLTYWPPDDPDAELSAGTFYLKRGHFITLAEMFRFGCQFCSAYDIYRTYVHLPIFIYKRFHSVSQAPDAVFRQNAKAFQHARTGKWGLRR